MKAIITIPAYNEERTIGRVIKETLAAMRKSGYACDILVLDDGSKDKTVSVAKKAGARVVSNSRNLGLALTFKREMEECLKSKADIIVHTDADGQYPPEYIPQMIHMIEEGYDLVLGSRFGRGQYRGSPMRKLGNIMFASVFTNLLQTQLTDTTTGFRAFTKEVACLKLINSFTYTQEQLIRAGKQHMRIGEIAITTRKTRPSRLFGNSFDYAFKAWINIFRIYRDFEPLKFFGSLGSLFFLFGSILGIYFIYLHFTTGIEGHLGLLFLMVTTLVTGLQIILFGFLADMLRK